MDYQTLKIEHQDAVERIQMYRPEANNSFNVQMTQELLLALHTAEANQAVKVIILEGLPDVFCTGMDFQELIGTEQVDSQISSHRYYDILKQMSQSSKVIVSLVRGKVQAGGVGLVVASDLVIADETVTFVLSELLFGLLPACVLPFLIRRVGFQKAYHLALTTRSIAVADAYDWGLIDEYSQNPQQLANQYVRRLKCLPSSGVKEFKAYMEQLWIIDQKTQDFAVNKISNLVTNPEVKEKIQRFVEEGLFPWQT